MLRSHQHGSTGVEISKPVKCKKIGVKETDSVRETWSKTKGKERGAGQLTSAVGYELSRFLLALHAAGQRPWAGAKGRGHVVSHAEAQAEGTNGECPRNRDADNEDADNARCLPVVDAR